MHRQRGFTLLELMVVVAILGIMAATAIPLYSTYRQRTYGSEAYVMAKQILDAQIVYFLEYNKFYPTDDSTLQVEPRSADPSDARTRILSFLNIAIPLDHPLVYTLQPANAQDNETFTVVVQAADYFPLHGGGSSPGSVIGILDRTGRTEILVN